MLIVLDPCNAEQPFPAVERALDQPNGLLAVGGCLSSVRLRNAYRHGVFPWYNEGEPILWWSPDPRLVLAPDDLHVSKSLAKLLRQGRFTFSYDACFEAAIDACAEPRPYAQGTWLVPEMRRAYLELHRQGLAHSFEAWHEQRLVGGLYGVAIGRMFFGESMFSRESNASKAAFAYAAECLRQWDYACIDCQVYTGHLASLGAREIPRKEFKRLLGLYIEQSATECAWRKPG